MDNKAAIAAPARTGAGPQAWGPPVAEEKAYIQGRQLLVVMVSVLLGILLAALDQTIVGPALPKIVGDLQGLDRYSWVVTVYLLTSTISVPIIGKLSDMYGRKWLYMAGIGIFLIGSALSGISGDMNQLIIYRGLQGLGAGFIAACAFAIIADLIPPADRGKWQGVFGSVFGLSSVIDPTLGGFITDNFSWHWIFYINVPVGILALAVLFFTFPAENKAFVRKSIDWLGAGALVISLVPLLIALSLGGTADWDWGSAKVLGMFAIAVVFMALFIFIESRAPEPIIPLDLFKNSIFTVSVGTVFVTGVGLFGAVLFIPLFIQAIQGDTATASGNAVTPLTLAVVVSSVITGQLISRTGKYRIIGILGMGLVTLGMALLWTMQIDTPRFTTIIYMIVMGLGLGVAFPLYTLVVQNVFPIQRVGVVTAAVQFFRSIGSTVGVAILGTVVNNQFQSQLPVKLRDGVNALPPQVSKNIPIDKLLAGFGHVSTQSLATGGGGGPDALKAQLLQSGTPPSAVDTMANLINTALKQALFAGIQEAFLIGAILLGLGFVLTIFLKEIPLRKSNRPGGMPPGEGGWGGGDGPEGHGGPGGGSTGFGFEQSVEEAGKEMAAEGLPGGTTLPAEEEPELIER